MRFPSFISTVLIVLASVPNIRAAEEPPLDASALPSIASKEPAEALATITVRPGFHMELAASEPLLADPVAMAFDEYGRLFVVEMRDYSERRDEHLGRVSLLEDTDGDGRFDKSTVYIDNLPWPTAVVCYNGGIFVGTTPDIIYCKDTDGDGKADMSEVAFTGFASDYAPYQVNRLNVQALMNSFHWGLDNRIHGSASMSAGKVFSPKRPDLAAIDLRGHDFSFDPRQFDLRAESGGGQHGMSFDNQGRKFVCSNSDHIQLVMYEDRYSRRNRLFSLPSPHVSIALDGPAAEVFRLSPDEPWRVIRTRWRVAGLVPGPVEGGGRPSGYFTGATGVTIYRGNAFPPEYQGDAFIADCGSNLIHHKKLRPKGVLLEAERPADEKKLEFAASTDNWFRPVQFANAPDGTLYVADMYRETIEHPWSLPGNIKQYLNLNSGNDRGRIYRIAPNGFRQPPRINLGQTSTANLVATLESANGWHRDTASRLLFERRDPVCVPLLEKLFRKSKSPLARLHALYVLSSLQQITADDLIQGMRDDDPGVRRHSIRLAEPLMEQEDILGSLWRRMKTLADDPDPLVRFQLAFSAGYITYEGKSRLLETLALHDASDPWIQAAILNSLPDHLAPVFGSLAGSSRFSSSTSGREFLRQLAAMIGSENQPEESESALHALIKTSNPETRLVCATSLGEGFQRAGSSLARAGLAGEIKPLAALAQKSAGDPKASESLRTSALRFLGQTSYAESGTLLLRLLEPVQSQPVQLAAIAALSRFPDPAVAPELVKRWTILTPKVRAEVLNLILARTERIPPLLDAVESGLISRADISTSQIVFLRGHRDPTIQARTKKIFAAGSDADQRIETLKRYFSAITRAGNTTNGRKIFQERCSTCHRLNGQGNSVGPDLASVRSNGKEKLLISILDPNREVAPNFLNYTIETKDGETFTGLIANETTAGITLRRANGEENMVARDRIGRIQTQNQSLMPEGLEAGLSVSDMSDLLEFIVTPE